MQWRFLQNLALFATALTAASCGFEHDKTSSAASGSTPVAGNGANTTGDTTGVTPTPTPTATPPATTSSATFTQLKQQIFAPKCVSCHGGNISPNLSSYSSFASDTRFLKPGDPENSAIYKEVKSGSMPQGGSKLSAAELQLVYDWIKNGALNN